MVGYVTITDASKELGLSRGTIWKRVTRRNVPYIKVGNSALVPFEAISGHIEVPHRGRKPNSAKARQTV